LAIENDVDRLHAALAEHQRGEETRLQDRKLAALAELAAGAGHEINTPLAIISGQAQYLSSGEDDPARRKSLLTIVQQAKRVHEILTDLMQFARPARPNLQVLDLALLINETAAAQSAAAEDRAVRFEREVPAGFLAFADPRQVRTILAGLLRNAVEAVPDGGWVRVRGLIIEDGRLEIHVEDSGPGPDPSIIGHLFDPFFSGRPAGRGRGLGLPTAWRLARHQGGDVRYAPTPDAPTRFVFTLPAAEPVSRAGRLTA
jgi:two-component system NtrC family sensor kinase